MFTISLTAKNRKKHFQFLCGRYSSVCFEAPNGYIELFTDIGERINMTS